MLHFVKIKVVYLLKQILILICTFVKLKAFRDLTLLNPENNAFDLELI